jgi:phage I-like protein
MVKVYRAIPIAIQLNEVAGVDGGKSVPEWVQILRTGQFYDPRYGDFPITSQMLASMKKNFDDKVLGVDIAADYAHESDKQAAGWFRGLELRENGTELWAQMEWTVTGRRVLSEKEFRYLSADFSPDYQNNETKKTFGPTLRGAGLTNRPVIKDMAPVIELTEGKGTAMNLEQALAKIQELEAKLKAAGGSEGEMGELKKKLSEAEAKCADYEKKAAESAKALAETERKGKFDKMLAEGKVVEAQRAAYMENDAMKFAELAQPLNTSARGSSGDSAASKKDGVKKAEDEVLELAEKKAKEEKIEIGVAISKVISENPELDKRYQSGT